MKQEVSKDWEMKQEVSKDLELEEEASMQQKQEEEVKDVVDSSIHPSFSLVTLG
jgi:hypothetical protein